ncbi:glucose-signaling factor 2 [Monosporozyma servazzii]
MEIYVRLCDDGERDYAFQVSKEDTINSKVKHIFDQKSDDPNVKLTLSTVMVTRPSIWHNRQPSSFYKSNHPGYLTEGGCLIFDYDAADKQYLVPLDENKPLSEQLWPGQLIVPKWDYNITSIGIIGGILLLWLYTDLPDSVSPTPGICLTNQLSNLVIPILENVLDNQKMADKLREEIQVGYSSIPAQWTFFLLHVFKIAFIILFTRLGLINPLSFNPFKLYKLRNHDLTQKTDDMKLLLKKLGWIGSRKASFDQYQQNFYNYMTKKYGGTVKLYKAGLLKIAAKPGFVLNSGEGFQTPLDERFTGSTFKEIDNSGKFILSEEYFIELENILKEEIDNADGDIGLMNELVKRFRRFGIYEPNEKIKELVRKRKDIYLEQLKEEKELTKIKSKENTASKKRNE